MTLLESLAAAQLRLEAVGFEMVTATGSGTVNRSTLLRRGRCDALLGADRGQPFVTLRASNGGDYHLGLWEACCDGSEPSLEARNLAADVETLASRVHEFDRLIAQQGAALDDCLGRMGIFVFHERRKRGMINRGMTTDGEGRTCQ